MDNKLWHEYDCIFRKVWWSKSITTPDGKTYIVFWKVEAAPVYYKPYVQLIDKDGNKVFSEQGILPNDVA